MTDIEKLRAALKPFADEFVNREPWAKHYNVGDTLQIGNHILVTMGDLRRAAEAYAALEAATLQPAMGDGWKPVTDFVFGNGEVVVTPGKRYGKPAVFIRPALQPGEVGASADRENMPLDTMVEGEIALTFPTQEHANAVEYALIPASPAIPERPSPDGWWLNEENGSGLMLQRGLEQIALIVSGNGSRAKAVSDGKEIAALCNSALAAFPPSVDEPVEEGR